MKRRLDVERCCRWFFLLFGVLLLATVAGAQTDDGPVDSPLCPAQDATGVGACDLFLGWRWNGMACEGLSGCSCVGADCGNLYAELEDCEGDNCRCLCGAQDATGVGGCALFHGWRWSGTECQTVSGCTCVGADCGNLFPDLDDCVEAHRRCPCAAQDVEPVGACEAILGYHWDGNQCLPLVGCSCSGSDCGSLYGSLEKCHDARRKCLCRAQDAAGKGPCDLFLGYRWNGESCEGISGCSCVGADCDALYGTIEECQEIHEPCPCRAQDAQGEGPCDLFLGYRWNGASCEGISGCTCVGSDCDDLFPTIEGCQKAHRGCLCRKQDAEGVGPCDLFLGWRWNGVECEPLSGCSCAGADCDELFPTLEKCANVHKKCACRAQDAAGEGPCDLFLGYRWTGSECEGISGCTCIGADCGSLFPTLAGCEGAHKDCDPCCGCNTCTTPRISPNSETP